MEEFNALKAQVEDHEVRITALEQSGHNPGPSPDPSPDGTTVTDTSGVIVDSKGRQFRLAGLATNYHITIDGEQSQYTQRVARLYAKSGVCYQENQDDDWWYMPNDTWDSTNDPTGEAPPPSGKFRVSNGQILDPNDRPFTGSGFNCDIFQFHDQVVTDLNTGAPATQTFPGLKYVRVNVYVKDMANLQANYIEAQVKALTKQGIVVVIDPHDYVGYYTGSAPTKGVYSGHDLDVVCDFMERMSAHYADDDYLWCSTENEPTHDHGAHYVEDMITRIYQAIRRGSRDKIVQLNPVGSYTIESWTGFDASIWRDFSQCAVELHYYNWASKYAWDGAPGYSNDLNTNKQAIANMAASLQAAHTADGVPPIVLGEYGDSTTGQGVDPGGMQAVQAVHESGYSTAAWHWYIGSDTGDVLLDPPPHNLTSPYGTTVRDHVQQRGGGAATMSASPPASARTTKDRNDDEDKKNKKK
jgi:hypothetical protein